MHRMQKLLLGLAVSALSAGGFTGLEAAFQGTATAQTVSNAPNVRNANNSRGHTVASWLSAQGPANYAPLPAGKPFLGNNEPKCDKVCKCKRKCEPNTPFCETGCLYGVNPPPKDEPKICDLADSDYWGCVRKYWEKKAKQRSE
jgi:hypothetical protein